MELNEKDSGDEPKKLWLHGRVVSTAMDMPQSKRTKTDIFAAQARGQSGKSTRGSIRFDSPTAGPLVQPVTKKPRHKALISFVDARPAPEVKLS